MLLIIGELILSIYVANSILHGVWLERFKHCIHFLPNRQRKSSLWSLHQLCCFLNVQELRADLLVFAPAYAKDSSSLLPSLLPKWKVTTQYIPLHTYVHTYVHSNHWQAEVTVPFDRRVFTVICYEWWGNLLWRPIKWKVKLACNWSEYCTYVQWLHRASTWHWGHWHRRTQTDGVKTVMLVMFSTLDLQYSTHLVLGRWSVRTHEMQRTGRSCTYVHAY